MNGEEMRVRNRLVILAKTPSAGRVKTRLARDIGTAEALRFYRHQLARTCRALSNNRQWQLVLSFAPDFPRRPNRLPVDQLIGQGRGDLGDRMQGLFDGCKDGPLIIIGADIPGITPLMISHAFALLKAHDHVFGPATDGGFWLVGQRRAPRTIKMFANVRWSSPDALSDTMNNLRGRSIAFIDELADIDIGADLKDFPG